MTTQSLVIVDDHGLFRQGIRTLLERSKSLRVIGEASDVDEAYQLINQSPPDVLLLDVILKTGTGFDLLERLDDDVRASLSVIILTMHSEPYLLKKINLFPCIKSYMLKDDVFNNLVNAIEVVVDGGSFVGEGIDQQNISMPMLSSREEQVMLLTARGLHLTEIADQLCISVKTVEKHRSNLFTKLNIRNAVELTRMAIRIGLIRP